MSQDLRGRSGPSVTAQQINRLKFIEKPARTLWISFAAPEDKSLKMEGEGTACPAQSAPLFSPSTDFGPLRVFDSER